MGEDTFDVDEFLDGYEVQQIPATVCMKAALVAEHQDADAAFNRAAREAGDVMHDPEVSRLRDRVKDIELQMEEASRTFWFKGVSYRAWHDLKRRHPPTDAQRRDNLDVNLETFTIPALVLCSSKPKINEAQANRLAETLPDGEIQKLAAAVWEANRDFLVPKSVLAAAIGGVGQSDRSSITAALAESLVASSSDADNGASPTTTTTTTDD
jgi:hypothetical protein